MYLRRVVLSTRQGLVWPTAQFLRHTRSYTNSNDDSDPSTTTNNNNNQEEAGSYPYTRGPYPTMYTTKPWTIRQYAGFSSPEESNAFYKACLQRGQTGLSVAYDLPTHRGFDSDNPLVHADVGMAGVPIDTVEDAALLFDGIPLDSMSVSMTMNGAVLPVMATYIVTAMEQGCSPQMLRGTMQNDILKEFMVRNTYIYPPKESLHVTAHVFQYCVKNMPKFHPISVSGYHMQEAGATAEVELAYTIADGLEYIDTALRYGMSVDDIAPKMSFFFGISMDFFKEVAKLRAARRMWARLVKSRYSPRNSKSLILRTHCQTSGYSLTAQQPYNNIVRTTIEAMAAVMGGTQSLHTNSFDEAVALPTDFSAQIARNTQLILRHETGFCDVVDPLGGSYHVEALTDDLEEKAMALIQEVADMGGMTEAILNGIPQKRIEESAIIKQSRVDSGKDVIVGVNAYTLENSSNSQHNIRRIDNARILEQQIARLESVKAARSNLLVKEALNDITEAVKNKSSAENLLELSVKAIKERATVGEVTTAMEEVWGRFEQKMYTFSTTMSIAGDDAWKRRLEDFEEKFGRRPRILIAKMGMDGHDRGAKVMATGLADMGFDVDIGPLFMTPQDVSRHAIDADVHIVGVSTQAGAHRTLVPELIEALTRELGGEQRPAIVCGGIIPPEDVEELCHAGVAAVYGPGTSIREAADGLLDIINNNT